MSEPANRLFHALRKMATPKLVTDYGRYDRAAVVGRAKELMHDGRGPWGDALGAAYEEAAKELARRAGVRQGAARR